MIENSPDISWGNLWRQFYSALRTEYLNLILEIWYSKGNKQDKEDNEDG